MLQRLATGQTTVNELAAPFSISQPAVSKHLKVLEKANLVVRNKERQTRPAALNAEPMEAAVQWLEEFKEFWTSSFDQLDDLLETLKKQERGENGNG